MVSLAPMILLALVLSGAPAGQPASHANPPEESPESPAAIQVEDGLLSVDVHDAPLGDVLHAIAEQAAMTIEIHGGGGDRVTESFAGVRLDEGIQRLARGHDVILLYGAGRHGERGRLVAAHVYEASAPSPPPAVKTALDPSQRAARMQAVRELLRQAQQQQPGALASLTAMLSSEPDPQVRASVARALGSLAGPDAAAALTAALGDQDTWVRVAAVWALGRRREEGAAGSVAQVLARDQDARVRRAAIWALSTLQTEDAHRAIEAAASDPDLMVRRAAAGALRAWALRHTQAN